MKKTITIIASILFSVSLSAKIVPGQDHSNLIKAKYDKQYDKQYATNLVIDASMMSMIS